MRSKALEKAKDVTDGVGHVGEHPNAENTHARSGLPTGMQQANRLKAPCIEV
jgi:hypothetical protein